MPFILITFFLFVASSVVADDSIEDIRASLQRTESSIKALKCSYLALREREPLDGEMAEKSRDTITWEATINESLGKMTCKSEMSRNSTVAVNMSFVVTMRGDMPNLEEVKWPEEWEAGDRYLDTRRTSPLRMSLAFLYDLNSEVMTDECKIVGRDKWEERPVEVVDVVSKQARHNRTLLWVDVERGIVVRELVYDLDENPMGQYDGSEFQEVNPGIWLPMKFHKRDWAGVDGKRLKTLEEHITITEWVINP